MLRARYCALGVTLLLSLWLGSASPAAGHAVLIRSDPPANTSLDGPPTQIVLWLSEPVDPGFSSVVVVGPDGKRAGDRPVVAEGGRRITVAVGPLARGVSTVRWRVLSMVDGHTTTGAFAFAMKEAVPPGTRVAGEQEPGLPLVMVRWAGFLAAVLLAGSAFFQVAVMRPALSAVNPQTALRAHGTTARRFRALEVFAALALLVGTGAEFLLRAAELFDTPLPGTIASGALWSFLADTKPGWGTLIRAAMAGLFLIPHSPGGRILRVGALVWFGLFAGLAAVFGGLGALVGSAHFYLFFLPATVYGIVAILLAIVLPQVPDGVPPLAWIAPLAGSVALAGFTVASHASGKGLLAIIADWAHLAAISVWIGGLVCLLLVLAGATLGDRPRLSRSLVPRFSMLAGIGLGIVIGTGLYSTWLHVPDLPALAFTRYGRALSLKLLLIVPLVALGALNRFVLRPRVTSSSSRPQPAAVGWLLRSVTGEVALGVAILLVAAALTITPPPREVLPAAPREPLILAATTEDVGLRLTITPLAGGMNRLDVVVTRTDRRPLAEDARMLLRLTKLDEELDPVIITLPQQGPGRYQVEHEAPGLPGWWEIEIIVRQRGRPDVSTHFPLRVGDPPAARSDPEAAGTLQLAQTAMMSVRTWREVEQLTDGNGGVVVIHYEFERPDRMRFRTSVGAEGVTIGATQYQRTPGGPWQETTLSQPVAVEGRGAYLRGAEAVVRGRTGRCDDEACRVILWEAPRRTAAFAAWIGAQSQRIHRLYMIAPSHYMTVWAKDLTVPLRIVPPR